MNVISRFKSFLILWKVEWLKMYDNSEKENNKIKDVSFK